MAWLETAPLGCKLSSCVKGLGVFAGFEGRGIAETKQEPEGFVLCFLLL